MSDQRFMSDRPAKAVLRLSSIAAVALLAAGCAGRDSITVGSVPDDYRTNHPIVISEKDKTVDIPVGIADRGLSRMQRVAADGFIAGYDRSAAPVVSVMVPYGSANQAAASVVAADLVKRLRKARPGCRAPAVLFLNSKGDPVTRARLSAAFGAAFRAAGLSGSGHWLRHTFAMAMLARLQVQARSNPDLNPLKVVQVLLGHASITTTAIYLRCVELHERDLSESLAYLYGELVPNNG